MELKRSLMVFFKNKSFILLALLLNFTCHTKANGQTVESIWENSKKTPGLQYMAVIAPDKYNIRKNILFFGHKNGKLQIESFIPGTSWLGLLPFRDFQSNNLKYQASFRFAGYTTLHIKFKAHVGNEKHNLLFNWINDVKKAYSILPDALKALNKISFEYKRIASLREPKGASEFKKMLRLLQRRYGEEIDQDFIKGNGDDFPLVVSPHQNWVKWKWVEKVKAFSSKVKISDNGNDAISKYLKIRKWYQEKDLPQTSDERKVENGHNGDRIIRPFYRKRAQAFTLAPFMRGANKYLRYEIVYRVAIICEGFEYYFDRFTWIFRDGPVYSYLPDMECD